MSPEIPACQNNRVRKNTSLKHENALQKMYKIYIADVAPSAPLRTLKGWNNNLASNFELAAFHSQYNIPYNYICM